MRSLNAILLKAASGTVPQQTFCSICPACSMDAAEVYWRLGENLADERFVDGALEEPFESGSLIAALMRIRDGLDMMVVRSD